MKYKSISLTIKIQLILVLTTMKFPIKNHKIMLIKKQKNPLEICFQKKIRKIKLKNHPNITMVDL